MGSVFKFQFGDSEIELELDGGLPRRLMVNGRDYVCTPAPRAESAGTEGFLLHRIGDSTEARYSILALKKQGLKKLGLPERRGEKIRVKFFAPGGETLDAVGRWHSNAPGRVDGLAKIYRAYPQYLAPGALIKISCDLDGEEPFLKIEPAE